MASEFGGASMVSGADGADKPGTLAALLAEILAVTSHHNERAAPFTVVRQVIACEQFPDGPVIELPDSDAPAV
ncbi:MAG: hypothetical protein RIQ93_1086 [Verrucomicrobiota bacterium]